MENINILLQINHLISKNLNNFVVENNLKELVGFFADAPIFFVPIFFIFAWIFIEFFQFDKKNIFSNFKNFFLGEKKILEEKNNLKSNLLTIIYGIILAVIINLIIQHIFFFDRPETIIQPILKHVPDASFPSDHATVSFAFLFGLFFAGYKKIFYSFGIFVILMNLSRIAGGLHWFFDIIGGIFVGLFSSCLIFKYKKNKYLVILNNFILKIAQFFKL